MAVKKEARRAQRDLIFALDIGTRSVIGLVGRVENEKLHVLAIDREDHPKRAMLDGQIEDILQVARIAGIVKERLERKIGCVLTRVCVAAAGRALVTQKATNELLLEKARRIDEEIISRLEAGAIEKAEKQFSDLQGESEEISGQFFLVGYSVTQYYLDNYPISDLKEHHGKNLKVDMIVTFLPSEVVESLYTAMHKLKLDVASLTLEPIAAINAAIPQNIRLLNLALADIGAGTSDIAVSKDGSIVGYTMATVAGDEITEMLMKQYLVDFETAERIKFAIGDKDSIEFKDILGRSFTQTQEEVFKCIEEPMKNLCKEISEKILEINGGVAPSAIFLAGGGSKLTGICSYVAQYMGIEEGRVAQAGNYFTANAYMDDFDIEDPEYATPLGIAISAGLNMINDSYHVDLNGKRAKLFRNGCLTIMDILMMNGYSYQDFIGRKGYNLVVHVDGKRVVLPGAPGIPAILRQNGQDAEISRIVCAGDSIEFIPAVAGKDAHATLADVVGAEHAVGALLNGVSAPASTQLKTGDAIKTIPGLGAMIRIGAVPGTDGTDLAGTAMLEAHTTAGSGAVPGTDAAGLAGTAMLEAHTTAGSGAAPGTDAAAPEAGPAVVMENLGLQQAKQENSGELALEPELDESETAGKMDETAFVQTAAARTPEHEDGAGRLDGWDALEGRGPENSEIPALTPAPEIPPEHRGDAPLSPKRIAGKFIFTLNGASLFLTEKEDGEPYYLMDLIQYSGIDLEHPAGAVRLIVNGSEGAFQQQLTSGDVIDIYCENDR